ELDADLAKLRPALAEMQQFADQIVKVHLPNIEQDIVKMRAAVPRRRAYLERLMARVKVALEDPCDLRALRVDPLESAAGGRASSELIPRLEASLANAEKSYANLSANF